MNLLDNAKVNDILMLEGALKQCAERRLSYNDFLNNLNMAMDNKKLTEQTYKFIKEIINNNNIEDIVTWENELINKIYSKIFAEASMGKFNISNGFFLEKYVGGLNCVFNEEIEKLEDVSKIRKSIESYLRELGLSDKFIFDFLIATAEATNNALVHHGSGSYMLLTREQYIYSYIFDKGQGIPISNLASAIFKKDFSTKDALGAGYRIILSKAHNVYIKYTNGVKILIEFEVNKYANN